MDNDLYREEYKRIIVPYAENKPRITIDAGKISDIKNLANEIVKAKLSEAHIISVITEANSSVFIQV